MANLSNINNKFLVTTTGEVLIGQTANNGNRLQITGADGASYIYLKTDVATTGGRIGFNGDDLRVFNQQASGGLQLGTAGVSRMRIDSSGVISIGPSTTSSEIYFNYNNTNNKGGLKIDYSTAELRLSAGESGNGYHQAFYTNGSERMRIDSVGLATFRSTYIIPGFYGGEVTLGGSDTTFGLQLKYNQDAATTSTIYHSPGYNNTNNLFKLGAGSGNTNQLVLKGDGNVGIGTDTPSRKLHIHNSATLLLLLAQ